ncbi:MAG: hypothetical protein AAFS07_09470 [Pseudomonadota bacterium]
MIAIRLNLVWTLFWHRFVPRNRQETLKLVWVFAEPAGQIAIMLAIFSFIGRHGGYGPSFALFLLTGVAVLTVVQRAMTAVATAVTALRSPRRLPTIGPLTDTFAAALFVGYTALLYTAALAWAIGHWQHVNTVPVALGWVVLALVAAMALGFGLGLIRGYADRFAPIVTRSFALISRTLIFISGVFYMPSLLPPALRDALAWNPVLQIVELMRRGFYGPSYPSLVLDPRYLGFCVALTATFGMVLVWANRRRLYEL